ncbi:Putative uncharacterized protein [Moritella viscosa]|uniref:Uncharacterized protein n=1 Tax=Moritella viscosa TaxID=80854 RepID=A0A1L0AQX4_9GAMM|nr:Putative uncharacterized protein [Moritella viscosa]
MKVKREYQKLINGRDHFDVCPDEAIDLIYNGDRFLCINTDSI